MKIEFTDEKILIMADAIKELDRIDKCHVPQCFDMKFGSRPSNADEINCVDNGGPVQNGRLNRQKLAHGIFKPMLAEGLNTYREKLRDIADGKE